MGKNNFSGRITVKNKDTGEEKTAVLDLDSLDDTNTILLKTGRDHVAGVSITLKSSGGYQGCEVSVWGSVSCNAKDFWNGTAHESVVDHLLDIAVPVIDHLEDGWIPEGKRPVRAGFSEKEGFRR